MACTCAAIQAADPSRHFKGCEERQPLGDRENAKTTLDELYRLYLAWQHAEQKRYGETETADAETFVDWVRDEMGVSLYDG